MKTISLRQPWAYLLCAGIKDIENRTWKLPEKYRGERVLIHAGKTIDNNAVDKIAVFNGALAQILQNGIHDNELHLGSIIGSVEIVDCRVDSQSIWAEYSRGWISDPKVIYHWVLANPILFDKPILNVKGKLGFWNYDLPDEYETILKL